MKPCSCITLIKQSKAGHSGYIPECPLLFLQSGIQAEGVLRPWRAPSTPLGSYSPDSCPWRPDLSVHQNNPGTARTAALSIGLLAGELWGAAQDSAFLQVPRGWCCWSGVHTGAGWGGAVLSRGCSPPPSGYQELHRVGDLCPSWWLKCLIPTVGRKSQEQR